MASKVIVAFLEWQGQGRKRSEKTGDISWQEEVRMGDLAVMAYCWLTI